MEEIKMTDENPYLTMDSDVLNKHITQMNEVMETKNLSKLQAFGESISEETQTKLDSASAVSQQLADAVAKIPKETVVNPEVDKLAQMSLDNAVSDIKAIDENFPIQGIMDSSLNSFDKIDALKNAKEMATYSTKAIAAVKSQVGTGAKPGTQGYAAPEDNTAEADDIVAKLIADSGVKVE